MNIRTITPTFPFSVCSLHLLVWARSPRQSGRVHEYQCGLILWGRRHSQERVQLCFSWAQLPSSFLSIFSSVCGNLSSAPPQRSMIIHGSTKISLTLCVCVCVSSWCRCICVSIAARLIWSGISGSRSHLQLSFDCAADGARQLRCPEQHSCPS